MDSGIKILSSPRDGEHTRAKSVPALTVGAPTSRGPAGLTLNLSGLICNTGMTMMLMIR